MELHFIAGLPRSGSTMLAAILRQNPAIEANMSSPLGHIFSAMQRAVSRGNEAELFLSDEKKASLLSAVFSAYGSPREITFDTNRIWPTKLPVIAELFPRSRMICCVREPAWVIDSIERLTRANTHDLSGIFGYEVGGTVYSRTASLISDSGIVGFAMNAVKEAFYGEHADRLLLIEYRALCTDPGRIVRSIYRWLDLPAFDHDYDHIETPPLAEQFDRQLGTPGLHRVGAKVEWRERETVLPPDLFGSFPPPFWRGANPRKVPVVHFDGA